MKEVKASAIRTLFFIAALTMIFEVLFYRYCKDHNKNIINNPVTTLTNNYAEVRKASSTTQEAEKLELWKASLEKQIKDYWGEDLTKIGLVYYDIERGQKIAINENKIFTAASTVKVQMNMIAYKLVRSGKLSLEEKLRYQEDDYAVGTGRILADYKKTKPIPINVLLDYSIKYSDNIATNMILKRLGGSVTVRSTANKMVGTNTETSSNKITAEQQFKLLKILYDNRDDKYYAHLIKVMKNTVFNDRLDKYIPRDIVAHKIGDYSSFVNDVGIIFTKKPYILVVYTNGLPRLADREPHEKIAKLSKLIYDAHLNK